MIETTITVITDRYEYTKKIKLGEVMGGGR